MWDDIRNLDLISSLPYITIKITHCRYFHWHYCTNTLRKKVLQSTFLGAFRTFTMFSISSQRLHLLYFYIYSNFFFADKTYVDGLRVLIVDEYLSWIYLGTRSMNRKLPSPDQALDPVKQGSWVVAFKLMRF